MFKETQYKSWFKLFRPRERAFKQFKCPRPQCVKIRSMSCLVSLSRRALLRLVEVWLIWNSLFHILTRLRAALPSRLDSIPIRDKVFSIPRCSPIGGGTTNPSTRFVQEALSPRGVTSVQCRGEECLDLFWLSCILFHGVVLSSEDSYFSSPLVGMRILYLSFRASQVYNI